MAASMACSVPFQAPPVSLQMKDLEGTWEVQYYKDSRDVLILRGDGVYKQLYQKTADPPYRFETPWKPWSLEPQSGGGFRVHLEGGRYYLAGIRIAELDGMGDPCGDSLPECGWSKLPRPFYDPYAREWIEMVNELVLTVVSDRKGNLLLHQMWTTSDAGFPLIGGEKEYFRRVDNMR